LCLGIYRGYFALEQLGDVDKTLSVYGSATWQPRTEHDWWVGYGVNEYQRKLLDFLTSELGLTPWKDAKRKFRRLQKQYLPLLDIPTKDEWLTLRAKQFGSRK
jgi:hypothetical protein